MSARRWASAIAPTSSAKVVCSPAAVRPRSSRTNRFASSILASISASDSRPPMKPSLQLKLSQHLTLTPQLQQSIKLLQLSTIELNQEIERFLLENPMLEREDLPPDSNVGSTSQGEASQEGPSREEAPAEQSQEAPTDFEDGGDWGSSGSGSTSRDDDDDTDFQEFQAAETSLQEHLDQQLALTPLSDRDRALARFIVEALDDDGYLSQSLEELLPLLPPELELEVEDLQIALHHVQNLEPTGVAARSP